MVAPPMSGSIQTFRTEPPVRMAWMNVGESARTRGREETHHGYVTKLMPANRQELEGIEDDPEPRNDPECKDDHCIHHDLRAWVRRGHLTWKALAYDIEHRNLMVHRRV